jgi:hypothetical protein
MGAGLMSADGAHLGVSAERALKTILGGEPEPTEDEQMDADTFRQWIRTADRSDDYGECARLCARYLLEYLTAHPEDMQLPLDATHDWARLRAEMGDQFPEPEVLAKYQLSEGVWDRAVLAFPQLHDLGLTGFQAGWAFNAARRCLELPPAPNPALLTVEVQDEP